jgi:hypothetical protein
MGHVLVMSRYDWRGEYLVVVVLSMTLGTRGRRRGLSIGEEVVLARMLRDRGVST